MKFVKLYLPEHINTCHKQSQSETVIWQAQSHQLPKANLSNELPHETVFTIQSSHFIFNSQFSTSTYMVVLFSNGVSIQLAHSFLNIILIIIYYNINNFQ